MTPKNITMFRFPVAEIWTQPTGEDLESALRENALRPVGPLEMRSAGFVPPMGADSEAFTHRSDGAVWITLGIESKILPGAVVADLLGKKLSEIEERDGHRVGARARKRIKEDLVHELLPRAFVKPSRLDIMIDTEHGIVAVDTTSRKMAELAVSQIRAALGTFPALPINAELPPRTVLTEWLVEGTTPDGWTLGDRAEMRDPVTGGAVVKLDRHELAGQEVGNHIEAGMQVSRLAVEIGGHVAAVVCDDLVIRRFKLLDGALDTMTGERDDIRAELAARFSLFVGEFRRVFSALEWSFRISKVED